MGKTGMGGGERRFPATRRNLYDRGGEMAAADAKEMNARSNDLVLLPAPGKHSRIVAERFRGQDNNLLKIRVARIQQPVIFSRTQSGRDHQQTAPCFFHKLIAE